MLDELTPAPTSAEVTAASRVEPPPEPGLGARLAVWVALALVAVHVAAIALWVGPDNMMRRKVTVERLAGYVLPMFDQNWSVFAPEADYGNDMFSIRAQVKTASGRERETDWVKVTEREIVPAVRHNPFPSRTTAITNRMASEHVRVFGALGQPQKDLVFKVDSDVALPELREKLLDAAQSDAERVAVASYMKVETAIEHFLSGIATTIWGDELHAFQIQRYRVVIPNYETWKGERLVEGGNIFTSNWRPPRRLDSREVGVYRAYAEKFGIR